FFAATPPACIAQNTVEELLELAKPQWEARRQQSYTQTGLRIEQLREHSSPSFPEVRQTRLSRDLFASGDLKLMRNVTLSTAIPLKETDQNWNNEIISLTTVTAQNAKYGFKV